MWLNLSKVFCFALCITGVVGVRFTPTNHVKQWPKTQHLELFDYVAQSDPTFEYVDTGALLNEHRAYGNWIGYLLNVTSQTWRTSSEVSISKWTHTLAIIVPEKLEITDQALLYLTGGDNIPQDIIQEDREDIQLASKIALNTKSIVSVMFQIPNQPIVFPTDSLRRQRKEDAIVGYTWTEFFRNVSRPELLAHVPMTKAGVRGMDTIEHFCRQKDIAQIKQFVIAGASKRGWTTWLVGAVDQRVKAIVPIVMDLLHLRTNLVHHYQSLGGWSFAFEDYYDLGLTRFVNTPLMSRMGEIIDVATYIDFLDMPKLVLGATGDEFFLLDDDHYWWGQLKGKTYRLIIPNAEHSLDTGLLTTITSVSGFYYAITRNKPIPEMTWSITRTNNSATLSVETSEKPILVFARQATTLNEKRRDFRLAAKADSCTFIVLENKYCIQPILWNVEWINPNTKVEYTLTHPKTYTAFLIEMTYSIDDLYLILTTQVVITPNTLPFLPPSDGETGILV